MEVIDKLIIDLESVLKGVEFIENNITKSRIKFNIEESINLLIKLKRKEIAYVQ